jgi:aminoglycoside phosphotransferase (APT) family kinase protein
MGNLATTVGDLDVDFLVEVLGIEGLERVHATRIGTGQVALSLRLDLEWSEPDDHERPEVLIAKIPATDPESRQAARLHRTYHKEIGFYRDIADRVAVPRPGCRHAEIDQDSGDFTLIMDPAPGTVGDQLRGCSPDEAIAIVDAAAALHGSTWNRVDEFAVATWLPQPDPASTAVIVGALQGLLGGFVSRYERRLTSSVLDAARWAGAHFADVLAAYRTPWCITHNDFRIDNMLFDHRDAQEVAVTVVDWQTTAFGRGPSDLAYGLGSGLVGADRSTHEPALVDRYAMRLSDHGIDVELDDIRHDYRLGTVSGLVMAVIASQLVTSTERGDEMFAVMAERHGAQMEDNDIWALVS